MHSTYTVTEIAKIAGVNPRSIQHWAASGILRPTAETNRLGTGTKRLFLKQEAIIACMMQPFLERQAPVGEMLRLSRVIRGTLLTAKGRCLLDQIFHSQVRAWLIDYPGQNGVVASLVSDENPITFAKVFSENMKTPMAVVIDLKLALSGLATEMK